MRTENPRCRRAVAFTVLWLAVVLCGCGPAGPRTDASAFGKAPPEIKTDWDAAVTADKANDYYTASTAYARIIRQESKLTPAQFETALEASRQLAQRMTTAAEQGDVAARQAMMKLMSSQGQR